MKTQSIKKKIATKTKVAKNYRNPKIEGNERKHKKDNHKKRDRTKFISSEQIGNSQKTIRLSQKTYSGCCYNGISNLEIQVSVKNKRVSRDFSSKYKFNESRGGNVNFGQCRL